MQPSTTLPLLLASLFVGGSLSLTYYGSCTPRCLDINGDPVQQGEVEDPRNCNNYYTCEDGQVTSAFPLKCTVGMHFDPSRPGCVSGTCLIAPATCIPICRFETSGGIELLADRERCSKYYLSDGVNPELLEMKCTNRGFFDGLECQLDPAKCCDLCMVFCDTAYTNVADPYDCTKFYFCQWDQYFPEMTDQHTCTPGQFFSAKEGQCVEYSTCSQLC